MKLPEIPNRPTCERCGRSAIRQGVIDERYQRYRCRRCNLYWVRPLTLDEIDARRATDGPVPVIREADTDCPRCRIPFRKHARCRVCSVLLGGKHLYGDPVVIAEGITVCRDCIDSGAVERFFARYRAKKAA